LTDEINILYKRIFIPSAGTGGKTMMAWIVWNLGKAALGAIVAYGIAWALADIGGYQQAMKAMTWVLSGDQPLVALVALFVSWVFGCAVYLLSGGDEM
jgi:hypothetical protein